MSDCTEWMSKDKLRWLEFTEVHAQYKLLKIEQRMEALNMNRSEPSNNIC